MIVRCRLIFYDGLTYWVDSNPGVAIVPLSKLWGMAVDAALSRVREHSGTITRVAIFPETKIGQLADIVWSKFGFQDDWRGIALFCIVGPNTVYFVEDESQKADAVLGALWTEERFVAFEFNNQAGEVLRGVDEGIRYSIRSREDVRHLPHVHVDFRHSQSASVGIEDGQVLEGKLSQKVLRKVQATIAQHRDELLDCWRKCTGFGLRADYSASLAID